MAVGPREGGRYASGPHRKPVPTSEWRNRQTHQLEGLAPARVWGVKSPPRHREVPGQWFAPCCSLALWSRNGHKPMPTEFFSDRVGGPIPQINDELPHAAWGGVVAEYNRRRDGHFFAESYPRQCEEGQETAGTNFESLYA